MIRHNQRIINTTLLEEKGKGRRLAVMGAGRGGVIMRELSDGSTRERRNKILAGGGGGKKF